MFLFNILLYSLALFGLFCLVYLVYLVLLDLGPRKSSQPTGKRVPIAGWGFEPTPKEEQRVDDTTLPKLIPSVHTLSLLERLYKIEYDELAAGTHDAFRDDHRARIPLAVHAELDYMDARASSLVIQSINYIRKNLGDEPLEIMPDFDDMLRRIIQRHEDEFNYPPTNFRY